MEEHVQKAARILSAARDRPLTPAEEKRLMAALVYARMSCNAAGLVDHETKGSPKLDEFARILEDVVLGEGRKVVVFSEWEKMIRLTAERADRLGIGHVILSGRVPTARREALIDRFREDPGVKVFFSTDAGGVGLNLQVAQTVINLDLPWNPARLEQRIARVHRLGQTQSVNVILLIAEASIETRIERIIESKRGLFDAVVTDGKGADTVRMDGGGLRLVREIVGLTEDGEAPAPAPAEPAEPVETAAPPAPPDIGEDVSPRLAETLGYRLAGVRRTRSGRLVAVVDRRDEEMERMAREAAGEEVVVVDREGLAALEAFGEDSPLADAAPVEPPDEAANPRVRELESVARRRLLAARKLAEAGLPAEALGQAHGALLAAIRARLRPEEETSEPDGILRAVYERLLPEERITIAEAGTLSRLGDLVRVYGDRDLEVPASLVEQALEESREIVEGS